jgi:hypothetical protein
MAEDKAVKEDETTKVDFLDIVSCMDKEKDVRMLNIKLTPLALKVINEFVVKSSTQAYMVNGEKRNRYLIRQCLKDGGFDVNGVFGIFFDKEYLDKSLMERTFIVQGYMEEGMLAGKIRDFIAFLNDEYVEMNRTYSYKYTVLVPKGVSL